MAIQVAERMSEEGREEAAKANLQVAKNYLEFYRGLLPSGKSEHVSKLEGEITKLQSRDRKQGGGFEHPWFLGPSGKLVRPEAGRDACHDCKP